MLSLSNSSLDLLIAFMREWVGGENYAANSWFAREHGTAPVGRFSSFVKEGKKSVCQIYGVMAGVL